MAAVMEPIVVEPTEVIDSLERPSEHSEVEVEVAREAATAMLSHPLTTEEAAGWLGVSKPTLITWIGAGILREASGSQPSKRLVWPFEVFAVRRVLKQKRLSGSLENRAMQLRAVLEDMFWKTHPGEAAQLQAAMAEADAGKLKPISGAMWEKARKNRSARAT